MQRHAIVTMQPTRLRHPGQPNVVPATTLRAVEDDANNSLRLDWRYASSISCPLRPIVGVVALYVSTQRRWRTVPFVLLRLTWPAGCTGSAAMSAAVYISKKTLRRIFQQV